MRDNFNLAFHPDGFKTLSDLSKISSLARNLSTSKNDINKLMDVIVSTFKLEDFLLYVADPVNEKICQYVVSDNKRTKNGTIMNALAIPYGKGVVGSAVLNKKVELVEDTRNDSRYLIDDKPRLSELTIPIIKNNVVIGAIDSEHSTSHFFNQTYLSIFKIMASLFVPFVDNVPGFKKKNSHYYYTEFVRLLEEEEFYKDPELNRFKVSQILGINPAYFSEVLSNSANDNFNKKINSYRVNAVKNMLDNEKYCSYSLLGIAFEAGFNSKSTFNRVFKQVEGKSPREYIRQITKNKSTTSITVY